MTTPLAPGPERVRRAPLPTVALLVGITLVLLACALAMMPTVASQLAGDPLVVRALAVTLAMAAVMLARVALRAAAGLRRAAALLISLPLVLLAGALLVAPSLALVPYTRGLGVAVPWLLGIPGIASLLLSRWRVH